MSRFALVAINVFSISHSTYFDTHRVVVHSVDNTIIANTYSVRFLIRTTVRGARVFGKVAYRGINAKKLNAIQLFL